METTEHLLRPLLERAEEYGKTNLKLARLKFVDKSADFLSTLLSRLLLISMLVFFLFVFNIAIGLWLGGLMGTTYLGFLVLALFYALAALIFLMIHPYLKQKMNNLLIKKALN